MTATTSYSIILALLTALAAGLVGSFALMKRMSLAGERHLSYCAAGPWSRFVIWVQPAGWSCDYPISGHVTDLAFAKPWHTYNGCGYRRNLHRSIGNRYVGNSERGLD